MKTGKISKRKQQAAATIDSFISELTELLQLLGISGVLKTTNLMGSLFGLLEQSESDASEVGEILSVWHRNMSYLDGSGNPRDLKILGPAPSFKSLATLATPRISPKASLKVLLSVNAVCMTKSGLVRPLSRFIPVFADSDLAKYHSFLALRGIVKTLRHNLGSPPLRSEQLFHRIAWDESFARSDIRRLKTWVNVSGQDFLESIDDWMKSRTTVSRARRKSSKNFVKASVGVYLAVD